MEVLNKIEQRLNNIELSVVHSSPYIGHKNSQKRDAIVSEFEKALNLNSHFSQKWDASFVGDLFVVIADELVELKAKNIVIETTPDDSILVKSLLQSKSFYLELFLTDEDLQNHDAIINLYENQKHIFGTAGLAKIVFPKVHKFLS